jgi:HK97 gp10 family phage protein
MATVEGLERFNAKLRRLPASVRAALIAANQKSAGEMVALAKRLAPVRSGKLKASIQQETVGDGVVRVKAGGRATSVEVRKGAGVLFDYALAVEFGKKSAKGRAMTGSNSGQKRGKSGAARAQPFFWPAYRATKPAARRRANRAMRLAIEKLAAE